MTAADRTSSGRPGSAGERYAEARARLGGAQKSKAGVPAYLRYVNRRIGGWLAAFAHALALTPNHVTALSAACSLVGIALLGFVDPSPAVAVAITFWLLLGFAFDSADGQLSRVRGDGKPSGEWLDHVVDVAKTSTLHAAVAVSLYRFADLSSEVWLLVPLAFGIVALTFFFGMMLRDQLGGKPVAGTGSAAVGSPLRSFVLLPMDYGTLCLTFLFLPWPTAFLVAYGGLLVANVAFCAQSFVKAYRVLAAPAAA